VEPSSRVGDGFVIVSHAQLAPCPDNLHVVSHSSSSAVCTYGSLCALNPHSDLNSRSVRADSIHVSMMFAHCGRADGTRKYDRPQSRPQSRPLLGFSAVPLPMARARLSSIVDRHMYRDVTLS